jgi:hypothetical protein
LWAAKAARSGNDLARSGKVGGKNGTVWQWCGHLHAMMLRVAFV